MSDRKPVVNTQTYNTILVLIHLFPIPLPGGLECDWLDGPLSQSNWTNWTNSFSEVLLIVSFILKDLKYFNCLLKLRLKFIVSYQKWQWTCIRKQHFKKPGLTGGWRPIRKTCLWGNCQIHKFYNSELFWPSLPPENSFSSDSISYLWYLNCSAPKCWKLNV